ncbi:hypothetical protein [Mesorhizobium huakuii]|uniref:Uncharacterized protein n=1 Tax=Mesorhizobium huakuii TaxID=28104 RepID=A0A7G6T673_9HYPH|nr:hypothetical protein [Mesorhizobium huakuii]QND62255.1 hypothetical protein HB778_40220 [Mesorhizobium huakuii]
MDNAEPLGKLGLGGQKPSKDDILKILDAKGAAQAVQALLETRRRWRGWSFPIGVGEVRLSVFSERCRPVGNSLLFAVCTEPAA